jgi:hypothetical protein
MPRQLTRHRIRAHGHSFGDGITPERQSLFGSTAVGRGFRGKTERPWEIPFDDLQNVWDHRRGLAASAGSCLLWNPDHNHIGDCPFALDLVKDDEVPCGRYRATG